MRSAADFIVISDKETIVSEANFDSQKVESEDLDYVPQLMGSGVLKYYFL